MNQEFSISNQEREITGSFSFVGNPTWDIFSAVSSRRSISLALDHRWGRWQRFFNAFLRVWYWPFGPKPLPKSFDYEIPNARIERVETRTLDGMKITSVDFMVVRDE